MASRHAQGAGELDRDRYVGVTEGGTSPTGLGDTYEPGDADEYELRLSGTVRNAA